MQDVYLTAGLTRNRKEFAAGETVSLPAGFAGKLVNRGRAVLHNSGVRPDAPLPVAARPVAPPEGET